MIVDLLPEYYERYEPNMRYDIIRSVVIDGHEVAWASYIGVVLHDITGAGHEGQPFAGYAMVCECDFTEGIGWNIGDNGQRYTVAGKDPQSVCLVRKAALYLRHLELHREYKERYGGESRLDLQDNLCEIILDLIKKSQNGEWLEDGNGAEFWGGHFYLQTVEKITGLSTGAVWDCVYKMVADKLICLEGAVVQSYTPPPEPEWEENFRIELAGWLGIALLPCHSQMAQAWRLRVLNPAGREAVSEVELPLTYAPLFGADVGDIEAARLKLVELMELARSNN